LADPNDFVRLEVRAALASGKPVIPLYLDGATLAPIDLPPDLASLLQRPALALAANALDSPNGLRALNDVQSQAIRSELQRMPRVLYPVLGIAGVLAALAGIGGLSATTLPSIHVFDSAFSTLLGSALSIGVLLAIVRTVQDRLWGWLGALIALIIVPFFTGEAYHPLQAAKPVWAGAIIAALLGLSLLGNRVASALTLWRNTRAG
jgi:hypothetical protein